MPNPFENTISDALAPDIAKILGPRNVRDYGLELLKRKMLRAMGIDYGYGGPYDDTQTKQDLNRDTYQRNKATAQGLKDKEFIMEYRNRRGPQRDENFLKKPISPMNISLSAGSSASVNPEQTNANRIKQMESGGNYRAIGPRTSSGQRAYGAYQVMEKNIGPWTKQFYGTELTPKEFLLNPNAQDAVFKGKFEGEYVPRYGPEGAARAWFAGEGGMNKLDRKDILGTSVAEYAKRFGAKGNLPTSPALGRLVSGNSEAWTDIVSRFIDLSHPSNTKSEVASDLNEKSKGTLHGFLAKLKAEKLLQLAGELVHLPRLSIRPDVTHRQQQGIDIGNREALRNAEKQIKGGKLAFTPQGMRYLNRQLTGDESGNTPPFE